jgi:hypothetical protein
MSSKFRSAFTYSNVMATIAVFAAFGGGAYAALKLPNNSVGSKQLKANAVNSSKVSDRSLLANDFRAGQLPAGQQGAKGDKGDTGGVGPSDAYFSKQLAQSASVTVPQGVYLVWGQCFKFSSSATTDLTCAVDATQNGGGASSTSLGGNSYAPTAHDATAMALGTATITNPAGGSISASGSGSTTTAVSAIRVGALHGP